jgi:hypothetical protein
MVGAGALAPVAAHAAPLADAFSAISSTLDQLAPSEQRRLLQALACTRGAGDALMLACGQQLDWLDDSPADRRALASSSSSSLDVNASSSGGCPYKHELDHHARRVRSVLMTCDCVRGPSA